MSCIKIIKDNILCKPLFNSNDLFDINKIKKNTPDLDKLSVTLKKHPFKGNSLYATKHIKKEDTIAYYQMKAFKYPKCFNYFYIETYSIKELNILKDILCEKLGISTFKLSKKELIEFILKNSKMPTIMYKNKMYHMDYKDMYHFKLYNKNGQQYKNMVGDLYKDSLPNPKNNIPYWGYFSNEPAENEEGNSYVEAEYKNLKEDDYVTYKVIAQRDIKKGEEIMWCYGSSYGRDYKVGKCK